MNKTVDAVSSYLDELNEAQREAVLQKEGPMIIIAGAGSGKTRVLTYRIAHLMQNGVDPFNILYGLNMIKKDNIILNQFHE